MTTEGRIRRVLARPDIPKGKGCNNAGIPKRGGHPAPNDPCGYCSVCDEQYTIECGVKLALIGKIVKFAKCR